MIRMVRSPQTGVCFYALTWDNLVFSLIQTSSTDAKIQPDDVEI